MKSTIRIDVDYDNQPVIKIEYQYSDDVRDTLIKKFLDSFWQSTFATFSFRNSNPSDPIQTSIIRPLQLHEMHYHTTYWDELVEIASKNKRLPAPFADNVGGEILNHPDPKHTASPTAP